MSKFIPKHFQIQFEPNANPEAIILRGNARFTILTSRLIRMEYSSTGIFEDHPSQVFWYRRQPVPEFAVSDSEDILEIETEHLILSYKPGEEFEIGNPSIILKETKHDWRFGDTDPLNLSGTARTLDAVDGKLTLEPGLMSRSGWALVDDSSTLIFDQAGWLKERESPINKDLYFFGYGHDYLGCLRDYGEVAGKTPLLPRWALGNWWSRYWAYTQEELTNLMLEFEKHEIPLSVCIVDMDWHITDTGNQSSGWTGYTWNRELFPEPEAFIAWLHERGLKTALNLHPAEGIYPHEDAYIDFANFMEVDPANDEPIPFNLTDPKFAKAYLEILHHPLEDSGVDFWWIDWQQGNQSGLPGLDPLWWLNHLHFYDLGREGNKRSFIFSRWGGLGNHRYPIGFSGDALVSWESLAFQPYFTATASNVGYGWWSHDIGGHMSGVEEPELYVRWVQYGVFSPIFRLHSTNVSYHERRPWGFDAETLNLVRDAMQLRHALIPYLYTMSWRNHIESVPLILPMYYHHAENEEAYHCPNQYYFGSELIAAPFFNPMDPDTRLSRQVVWLPEGDWYDFFTGEYFSGDNWHVVYGELEEIPLFAKAGAIIPLGSKVAWGGVENTGDFEIIVFVGSKSSFLMCEDDGGDIGYAHKEYCLTQFSQNWRENQLIFEIEPAEGDAGCVSAQRDYSMVIRGIKQPESVSLVINGKERPITHVYDMQNETVRIEGVSLGNDEHLVLTLSTDSDTLLSMRDRKEEKWRKMLRAFRLETLTKHAIDGWLPGIIQNVNLLADFSVNMSDSQIRALIEISKGVGVHQITAAGADDLLILWNNQGETEATFRLSAWDQGWRFYSEKGAIPKFQVFKPSQMFKKSKWEMMVNYYDLITIKHAGQKD